MLKGPFFWCWDKDDMANVRKLQASQVTSRQVVGRGTLVADAAEIRRTASFQRNVARAAELVGSKNHNKNT